MALRTKLSSFWAAVAATFALTGGASAQALRDGLEIIGAPHLGGVNMQTGVTELAHDVRMLDNLLLVIITAIVIFVTALMVYSILRHNRRANPKPATFTHNRKIEIIWTVVPMIILFVIGGFSLPVLFKQQTIPDGEVVIKATGYQWYWGYEYPQHDIVFDSFMLAEYELAEYGYTRDEYLLATNTAMVVPTGRDVVVQVTGADVIHSWTIPAFGVKQDGIPGRLAQLWFNVEPGREGIYFGQCSELCGVNHAYMPITVFAVTPEEYDAWTRGEISDFASVDARAPQVVELAAAQ